MNKITKTLLSILTIALILGLAFYPKIKKTFFAAETKEKGKEKGEKERKRVEKGRGKEEG